MKRLTLHFFLLFSVFAHSALAQNDKISPEATAFDNGAMFGFRYAKYTFTGKDLTVVGPRAGYLLKSGLAFEIAVNRVIRDAQQGEDGYGAEVNAWYRPFYLPIYFETGFSGIFVHGIEIEKELLSGSFSFGVNALVPLTKWLALQPVIDARYWFSFGGVQIGLNRHRLNPLGFGLGLVVILN